MKQIKNISTLSDLEIIALYVKSKDKSYVGELYKRYTGFVFLISMKYLKDEDAGKDAVMQIFEKLFSDLLKHEISNFKSWLHTVTRNHCLLILRNVTYIQKKETILKKETDFFMDFEADFHLNEKEENETKLLKLDDAINQLNEEQKLCVKLFYIDSKSYKEVADLTGYDINKVKSFIQNGKRNLKIILEKSGLTSIILLIIKFLN